MVFESSACIGAKRRGARIGPDVRAPTTAFSEVDVVDVCSGAFLEQGQKFMLRPIETAHAGVGLRPDDEIQRDEAEFRDGRMNGRRAAPVDERAEDPAVAKIWQDSRHPGSLKARNSASVISPDAIANSR